MCMFRRTWVHSESVARQSARVWKGFWIGMASVKALFIPLCLQLTKRRSLIYIFTTEREKNTRTCSEQGLLFISPQHSSSARGAARQRKLASGRARQKRERREAGIKSACWKKQDGHKRWTKLQRGLFLSKANGNISTQHREGSAGSIITAEQTELAAIPEERRDARAGPA